MRASAIILSFGVLLAACKGSEAETTGRPGRGGRGGRNGLAFAADVMPVESKKAAYVVTAPGTIDAFERVQVTARVAGAVDRVAFSEGQSVKKGDALVVIDSERFRLAVDSAKAALDKAEASLRDAEAGVKRREAAAGTSPGLIPGEELETYRTKAAAARADRAVAITNLRTAEVNLRDSYVRAPMEGVIQTRTVETGQYVGAGYVMATLLRSEPLLLRFQVDPAEAPRLQLGMTPSFTMRETQRTYTAKITLVAASADPTTHMVPVTAEIADDGHKYWLRPGSFCDVSIELDAQREAPLIPRLAARATDHGYVAFVVEGDVAHERKLALGMSTKDGWVEVRSGIKAGDLLVVRGAEALSEGAKVRPNQVTPEAVAASAAGKSPPPAPSGSASAGAGEDRPRKRRDGAAPAASGSAEAPK
ncbi:MAG: efflux RND transporter periplasmic adaptor subunit [Minicystis sp.]